VTALLAYAEDEAGGLMSPRFVRLRPDMRADEALRYLRKQADERPETLRYAYVLEAGQRLVGVASLRQLFLAPGGELVRDLMRKDVVTVRDDLHEEEVARVMTRHNLSVVPVVDAEGCIKGIVTADDAIEVVKEAATEDMQKLGGMEALETSYLGMAFVPLVRKRAGWLAALFLGEMLTATAMGRYEDEIARAVVLALFVPLIISSGGNSGSQATTLVIRAMALGEVKLRDWWRVLRREVASGLVLGIILAGVGLVRILAWQALFHTYGEHAGRLAVTVAVSLIGVVMWGTLAGSMLPFALRRVGFDPASASAPFVATLVDVCGLIIYFNVASVVLRGALLLKSEERERNRRTKLQRRPHAPDAVKATALWSARAARCARACRPRLGRVRWPAVGKADLEGSLDRGSCGTALRSAAPPGRAHETILRRCVTRSASGGRASRGVRRPRATRAASRRPAKSFGRLMQAILDPPELRGLRRWMLATCDAGRERARPRGDLSLLA
jgi:magnesium transporter